MIISMRCTYKSFLVAEAAVSDTVVTDLKSTTKTGEVETHWGYVSSVQLWSGK